MILYILNEAYLYKISITKTQMFTHWRLVLYSFLIKDYFPFDANAIQTQFITVLKILQILLNN